MLGVLVTRVLDKHGIYERAFVHKIAFLAEVLHPHPAKLAIDRKRDELYDLFMEQASCCGLYSLSVGDVEYARAHTIRWLVGPFMSGRRPFHERVLCLNRLRFGPFILDGYANRRLSFLWRKHLTVEFELCGPLASMCRIADCGCSNECEVHQLCSCWACKRAVCKQCILGHGTTVPKDPRFACWRCGY